MKRKYEHEAFQVIREDMIGMHELGIISDARMREYDEMCLVQEDEPAEKPEKPLKIEQVTI